MKINDVKIGTHLRLGLGSILLLVLLLGVLALRQANVLWEQTRRMYDHPLTVSRALGQLEVAEKTMSLYVRNLLLAQSEAEVTTALQGIEISKNRTVPLFAILTERYLGPREDITNLQDAFSKWGTLRDETVRLFRTGKRSAAESRLEPGGVQDKQAEEVQRRLRAIDDFALAKASEFFTTAKDRNTDLNQQLALGIAFTFLLTLLIGWRIFKSINLPLSELTKLSDEFSQGRLAARSTYASTNELGTLSVAFNAMADAIQTQSQISEHAAQISETMLREEETHAFCRELLKALLSHTGSQVGAIYFLNEAKTDFERIDSIGLNANGSTSFPANTLDGELGITLATRQIQHITDIPPDTRFSFRAVSGEFIPREILSIPILSDHNVSAVISLASVRAYDAPTLKLINDIWNVLCARVNGVLVFRKLQSQAERLESKNRELDEQKRELSLQARELNEQNIELDMQKRQVDEANRLKSAFLSNMSHELRTPLNSVIALSGVLNRRLARAIPEEEYSYLEIIERNGKNLLELINDILDLSRIEAGYEEVNTTQFSLRELTDEIIAMLEPLALEKNITLFNQIPADLPLIVSDPAKCRHILQNIAGNAVKFTEQGGVTINARAIGKEIEIIITDTGIGIPAAQIPHIFDEFRQGDGSTSRKYGGTGLGLAIARKYAKLLEGGITVESTPGQGSTFILRLPLALQTLETFEPDGHGRQRMPQDNAPKPLQAGHSRNILVVEDSEPAIIQLTDILQAEGYCVHVAHNGKEALKQIGQTLPDAMILDLMMPEVDGFAVLRQIRNEPQTSQIPVLILTAKHVSKEELSFLKSNHVYQLIQKGDINRDGLLKAVSGMISTGIEPPAPRPVKSPRAHRRRTERLGKPLVLVVEDNPDSRCAITALLRDRFQLIEAVNGETGVEQARTQQPDLILMDIAMPVMDGIQALHAIRTVTALQHIPIIAVTASAMKGDQETILAHGFDAYLSKPIDEQLLLKTLNEALD